MDEKAKKLPAILCGHPLSAYKRQNKLNGAPEKDQSTLINGKGNDLFHA